MKEGFHECLVKAVHKAWHSSVLILSGHDLRLLLSLPVQESLVLLQAGLLKKTSVQSELLYSSTLSLLTSDVQGLSVQPEGVERHAPEKCLPAITTSNSLISKQSCSCFYTCCQSRARALEAAVDRSASMKLSWDLATLLHQKGRWESHPHQPLELDHGGRILGHFADWF